jgi:ElaA protein
MLRLRQEVFAVEQNSIYLDVDGRDPGALHLFAEQGDGTIVACCRILAPGVKYAEASIGRVCTARSQRNKGIGIELMQRALAACAQRHPSHGIRISAQQYLKDFYSSFGFVQTSPAYDEDGIAHIEMLRVPPQPSARQSSEA